MLSLNGDNPICGILHIVSKPSKITTNAKQRSIQNCTLHSFELHSRQLNNVNAYYELDHCCQDKFSHNDNAEIY